MRNACHVRILKMAIVQRDRNINFLIQMVGLVKKVAPMYNIIMHYFIALKSNFIGIYKTHIIFLLNKK